MTSSSPLRETRDEALDDEAPPIDEDEEEELTGECDHRWWKREHPHTREHRCDDEIEHDEGQEDRDSARECGAALTRRTRREREGECDILRPLELGAHTHRQA